MVSTSQRCTASPAHSSKAFMCATNLRSWSTAKLRFTPAECTLTADGQNARALGVRLAAGVPAHQHEETLTSRPTAPARRRLIGAIRFPRCWSNLVVREAGGKASVGVGLVEEGPGLGLEELDGVSA